MTDIESYVSIIQNISFHLTQYTLQLIGNSIFMSKLHTWQKRHAYDYDAILKLGLRFNRSNHWFHLKFKFAEWQRENKTQNKKGKPRRGIKKRRSKCNYYRRHTANVTNKNKIALSTNLRHKKRPYAGIAATVCNHMWR